MCLLAGVLFERLISEQLLPIWPEPCSIIAQSSQNCNGWTETAICNDVLSTVTEAEFHYNCIVTGSIIVPPQTSFFKAQFTIKTACGDIGPPNFKRDEACFFAFCLVNRIFHQPLGNP